MYNGWMIIGAALYTDVDFQTFSSGIIVLCDM